MDKLPTGRTFWLQWLLASSLGLGIGFPIGSIGAAVLSDSLTSTKSEVYFAILLMVWGASIGASLGIGQWLVLRHYLSHASRWILGGTVSLTIALVPAIFAGDEPGIWVPIGLAMLVTAYWLVLRGRIPRSGYWALNGSMGLALAIYVAFEALEAILEAMAPTGFAAFSYSLMDAPAELLVAGMLGGAASGALFGFPARWLLRRPLSNEERW